MTTYRYAVKFANQHQVEVIESSPGALMEAGGVQFYPPNRVGWKFFPHHMIESIERLPEGA